MKRLFVFLACLISLAIFSCSDSKDDNGDDPNGGNSGNVTLELSTTDIVFEAGGGEKEFYITCNGDWTIANASQWCKTDITSGNGNATISVTVNPSELYDDQNTNITVKAGTNTKILTVTQKKKDAILLTKDKYDLPTTGGNITVEVKSNITYTTTIPQEFNWIKQADSKSRALETKNLNFKIEANPDTDKREGFIIFKDNGSELADTVRVYQAQKDELILTQETYSVPAEGETINVELKTNVDYEVIIPEDAKDWIEQLASRASRVDRLSFAISENITYDDRQAEIVIKDKNSDLADTLCVIQEQVNAIILGRDKYEISSDGEVISVEVKSNIDHKIVINHFWIKEVPKAKGLQTNIYRFEIEPNTNYEARNGKIIFKNQINNISDTLHVEQKAKPKLTLVQKIYNIQSSKTNVEVNIETNLECRAEIPENAKSWIQQIQPLSIQQQMFVFEVQANLGEERQAKIVIKGEDCLTDTIQINQAANNSYQGNVIVETENDLLQLKEKNIKKITGDLIIQGNELVSLYSYDNLLEEIEGNLIIDAPALTTLDGLYNLKRIGGNFLLESGSLVNFEGLNHLTLVGGEFKINSEGQDIPKLESFNGLEGLEYIAGDFNISSTTLKYINDFLYYENSLMTLKSLDGLNNLKSIGGDLIISANGQGYYDKTSYRFSSLLELRAISLPALTSIGGNLEIQGSANSYGNALDRLNEINFARLEHVGESVLVRGGDKGGLYALQSIKIATNELQSLTIRKLDALKSLEGLEKVKAITGNLLIHSCKSLESMNGLNNLETIGGDLRLFGYLTSLISFNGLNNLKSINGGLLVEAVCPITSFEGLNNLEIINGNFDIISSTDNASIYSYYSSCYDNLESFKGLEKLKIINGDFNLIAITQSTHDLIPFKALKSFEGLNNLEKIGGKFEILSKSSGAGSYGYGNSLAVLKNFTGLSNLKSIGGDFKLTASSKDATVGVREGTALETLESFEGLASLKSIGGNFIVSAEGTTKSLKSLQSFEGLNQLKSIGGELKIVAIEKGMPSFISLGNLSLESINGNLTISHCSQLTNIDGLSELNSVHDISITHCSTLYDFTIFAPILQEYSYKFYTEGNAYNPTKYQILNGQGKPQK